MTNKCSFFFFSSKIGVGKNGYELFLLTLVWMIAVLPRLIFLTVDDAVSDLGKRAENHTSEWISFMLCFFLNNNHTLIFRPIRVLHS